MFSIGRMLKRTTQRRPQSRRPALHLEALEERTVPTLLGNSLFPVTNPWNQNITNAPVAPNSGAIISNITANYGDGRLHPDFGQDYGGSNVLYGIPYNVVHGNSTPKVHVVIDAYASESDVQDVPLPSNVVLEGDFQNGPASHAQRGDSHLLVYDVDNDVAYEFYNASRPTENADGKWHASQETVWNMNANDFRTLGWTSADAAGLPILPGLVRPDEALPVSQGGQGVIDHAIRMTLQNSIILDQFLYPASHTANGGNTNPAIEPPMGARFRLKASVDLSQLNPESRIIAQAMKDYGLIVADNGSNFFISGASYSVSTNNGVALTYDDNDIQDSVHGLKSLDFNDFEVVSLAPVVTGLSTTNGPAGTTVAITGQNFSGAAGQLQVLFGAALASHVTLIDDGHVTATAPPGTGVVDVRVQSGVSAPGNSSNVNNPIFGYGLSPLTPADQFTYGVVASRPMVAGVSPAMGPLTGGVSVTITGLNLSGATGVAFGAVAATRFTIDSPTQITAVAPAEAAGVVGITVTTPTGGASAPSPADQFSYLAPSVAVVELPGSGVWRYTAAGGQQLTPVDAVLLTNDASGDVAGEFSGAGVWRYETALGWKQLTSANPSLLAMDAHGDVFAAFPGAGLYQFTSSWQQLTAATPTLLAVDAGGDAAGEFPGAGVYLYTALSGRWQQVTQANAATLAIDNAGDVAAGFLGVGLYRYTASSAAWRQLTAAVPTALSMDARGDVTASFQGAGLWQFTAGGWQQLTPATPSLIAMDAYGDVYAEFTGAGLYDYQVGIGWKQVTGANPRLLFAR